MFYDKKLETDPSVSNRTPLSSELEQFWPRSGIPIAVFNVVGKTELLDSSYKGRANLHSMVNKTEAEKVVNVLNMSTID